MVLKVGQETENGSNEAVWTHLPICGAGMSVTGF